MSDTQYSDDDFVYIDPAKRAVMGKVEWSDNGIPAKMEKKEKEAIFLFGIIIMSMKR